MRATSTNVGWIVVCIVVGSGAVLYLRKPDHHVGQPPASAIPVPSPVIHTADWYVAHPAVLFDDEKRCAGNAATISPAACQNVSAAAARRFVNEMRNAASANGQAGAPADASAPAH